MKRYHLTGQKKNNKGASLVMVLVVMAVITMLALLAMSAALVNARMKGTRRQAAKNFYDAETALEEIRLGLANEMSDALSTAYVDTVQKYSTLKGDERGSHFKETYVNVLKSNLDCTTVGAEVRYSTDALQGYLKSMQYEEWDDGKVGAKVDSANGSVTIDADGTFTLKKVQVTCWNEEGYQSKICTDLVLECPKIQFSTASGNPDITSYALVTEDHLEVEGGSACEITGNAYLGEQDTVLSNASLQITPGEDVTGRGIVALGAMLKGEQNAGITIDAMEVWADSLVADSSRLTIEDSAVYLHNDLILSNSLMTSTTAKLSGEFYGYGNTESALKSAAVLTDTAQQQEIAANPADYSSSIIINGISSSLDILGLSALKISGNAYINATKEKSDAVSYRDLNAKNILMGSSLSIRADQLAYLVPAECIAPEMENGGTNPMPISQYSTLLKELQETCGDDAGSSLVDLDEETVKYGSSLRELGVDGWQIAAHQVNGVGSMVYVFLQFDRVQDANTFYRNYYQATDQAKLNELLDLYSGAGILLPEEAQRETLSDSFYFNGNVLASDTAQLYVADTLASEENRDGILAEEIENQNTYAALQAKLMKNYTDLTADEKKNSVYDNLVNDMVSADDSDHTIGAGTDRIFVKTTGEAAVVANGDCVVGSELQARIKNTADVNGTKHTDAKLSVVIASGNITVTEDFTGLLLCRGTVYTERASGGKVALTADREAVSSALTAVDANGVFAYEYLNGGEGYVISGSSLDQTEYAEDRLEMLVYISYDNWSRQ